MAEFDFNGFRISTATEDLLKSEKIERTATDGVEEYKISLDFGKEVSPKTYTVTWDMKQVDMIGFWSSTSSLQHNITPDWWVRSVDSKTASGMPLIVLYNKANQNRACVALSDPLTSTRLSVGVVEETGCVRFKVEIFSTLSANTDKYEAVLRIDTRPLTLVKAIGEVRDWWTKIGYTPAYVPEGAKAPLYSAWYSFHQRTIPEEIIAECKVAKECGMDTLIVDDGWQTDDGSRGYAYCGDWKICERKIPDMKDFVDKIHALGMKFMIWFSVPYVGIKSQNYERFKGKYLYYNKRMGASILDPRFKEVRDFLVNIYVDYVKKYGWDGLKLDFIDSFRLTDESSTDYEAMDCVSVEEAVNKLLYEITTKLRAINPEFLIEFRQSYIGPAIVQYGNMLRATDCPNDAILNRVHTLHLRMTSAGIPVHSDMLMWNKNDTPEAVAYQLFACMFSVPQISILFDNITSEHKRVLKAFLSFWREHRDTVLDSELELFDAEANFSMARAFNEKECVCVQYQQLVANVDKRPTHVFNSTGSDGVYVELECDKKYEIYNIYGELYAQGTLNAGIHLINAKNCERVSLI